MSTTIQAPFALSAEGNVGDILDSAKSVTRFLCEMAPHLCEDDSSIGISAKGVDGLWVILDALEKTIEAAVESL